MLQKLPRTQGPNKPASRYRCKIAQASSQLASPPPYSATASAAMLYPGLAWSQPPFLGAWRPTLTRWVITPPPRPGPNLPACSLEACCCRVPSQGGDALVVDPTLKEEAACAGVATVVVNTHGQVCAVQQLGGIGLNISQVPCQPQCSEHPGSPAGNVHSPGRRASVRMTVLAG